MGNYTCLYEYHSLSEDKDGHNHFCLAVWHCATAALHTEGGTTTEACWKGYNCLLVNK